MIRTGVAIAAVAGIVAACAPASQTPAAPAAASVSPTPGTKMPFSGIKKADKTVAEIYAEKEGLSGTVVNVRGKVVKFSVGIMGKNWAHVQDGSGANGTNDLTVTTQNTAKVGDTVLVSGKISLNRDFGGGYKYALIIEDGSIVVE
jgi:hypothetical protein